MQVVCSVFDRKTEEFMTLWLSRTEAAAVRVFSNAVRSGEAELVAKHPEDFALYMLGTFDESSGELAAAEPLRMLVTAERVLAGPPSDDEEAVHEHSVP